MQLAQKNVFGLLKLVSQLLDFSKIESGMMNFKPELANLNDFIKECIDPFEVIVVHKNIDFRFIEKHHNIYTEFDQYIVEKVINNLLSNAFKFTLQEGIIHVSLDIKNNQIEIEVKDSGVGIPSDQLPVEAANGAIGIEKAFQSVPDLIISDVMMPKKDGFELLSALKKDNRTSHIPIIMLTAKATFEDKIKGLETGADDYLTKPFDSKELLLRVRNIIRTREKLRELFRKSMSKAEVSIEPSQVTVSSMDETFLKSALEIVEKNIDNHTFDVTLFCAEIGMSRANLFKKLKSITNLFTT